MNTTACAVDPCSAVLPESPFPTLKHALPMQAVKPQYNRASTKSGDQGKLKARK